MFFIRLRAETRKGWFRLPRDGRRRPGLDSGASRRARMFDFIAAGGMRSLGGRPIEEAIARRRAGMMTFCFLLGILWIVFYRIPPPA